MSRSDLFKFVWLRGDSSVSPALVTRLLYQFATIVLSKINKGVVSLCVLAASAAWLYADVARRLVSDWYHDDNYSHGFLIVPLALYFAYERREQLQLAPRRPMTWLGLLVVAGSLFLLVAGTLGSEFFLTRVSLIGALAGTVLFLLGWPAPADPGVPAGVPVPDDSRPGDHLQSDRVPAAAGRLAVRRIGAALTPACRCCGRAT